MSDLPRLGVNIDHVATIRNARGGDHPDPVRAARLAAEAGAEGITAHLREDRRHIGDNDIQRLVDEIDLPLNLEMAATDEMVEIALRHRPPHCCIVPEKREERTTEGGLDAARHHNQLAPVVRRLREEGGIRVSLFIEPDPVQVAVASALGAEVVEFHTGRYVEHVFAGETKDSEAELERIRDAATDGAGRGLEIHAGHGLTFDTVKPVAAIAEMRELNIGHFLMGEAIFIGLEEAIRRMKALIAEARA
ncbi:pyridoxine 5'-phosphate synthase [Euryhalocaulis caribicus]|uniref:pyridoxine 5'-phosphate synthase n=1 Tax=Euryhalocaulis caribicus TaxID=1161401 RepID=UPI0003A3EEF4|nr:pyridoxine 5'-phosphate synthase [Euryhalocaulis caribicus]